MAKVLKEKQSLTNDSERNIDVGFDQEERVVVG